MARKAAHHGVSEQAKAAIHRREDAQTLFDNGRWRGSMYMAGYAVECLLKVQLMRKFGSLNLAALEADLGDRGLLPGDQTVLTHQLRALLQLTSSIDRLQQNVAFWRSFNLVNRWVPAWRYTSDPADAATARTFLADVDLVLTWVRNNV